MPASPHRFSRRKFLAAASSAPALLGPALLGPAIPARADTPAELVVTEALRSRRSTRAFATRAIDPALMAQVLWAAFGVNRPDSGLHTAPSWHGSADVSVHVATAEGVMSYDPASNSASSAKAEDIRKVLSPEPFVATAPACLIFVSDLDKLEAAKTEEDKRFWATVDAAMAAENVYLFAAAHGLGTCLIGGLDRAAIGHTLGLAPRLYPTFVQPIGWPA